MKPIASSFCHINLQRKVESKKDKEWAKPLPLEDILKSEPKK